MNNVQMINIYSINKMMPPESALCSRIQQTPVMLMKLACLSFRSTFEFIPLAHHSRVTHVDHTLINLAFPQAYHEDLKFQERTSVFFVFHLVLDESTFLSLPNKGHCYPLQQIPKRYCHLAY